MTFSYSRHDVDTLARTLWGEARSEGVVGMEAVAAVIVNRVRDRRWPKTPAGVCKQRWQFSAWNENDPNLPKLRKVGFENEAFQQAYAVAAGALAGLVDDRVEGANHYLNESALRSLPGWADASRVTCRIGRHTFYRL